MSLPPRSAKSLAVFQLSSKEERIIGDWVKPKSHKPAKSKRQSHPKETVTTSAPTLEQVHEEQAHQEPTAPELPATSTANHVEKEVKAVKKVKKVKKHKSDAPSPVESDVVKKSTKSGKNHNNDTTSKNELKKVKMEKEEETPSQHEITNGKKKASKLTPAVEYSMRPNCDPVKLAKMIQQERQKGFHYVKTNAFPPGRPSRKPDADDVSVCSCYVIDGLDSCGDHNCMNRLVCIECDPRFCPCEDKCMNQRFQKSQYAKVMPFKTDHKGWGLKTLEPLIPQQFVFEYCGEVINNEMCRQRLESNPDEDNFYFITLDRSECIDASNMGNLARFMNHSCEPNCQTQKWVVNGELRIGLFAKYDVPAGTELTFDYNFERFGSKKQKCYCGTATCRGYLGAKPKHMEAELKKKNAGKRKPAAHTGKVKHTKTKAASSDITLVEQNWGLPPPPKKARHNYVVDHAQHVTALLGQPESGVVYPKIQSSAQLYLRRNVRLVRKCYSDFFKTCVAQALSSKSRKGKSSSTSKSPSNTPSLGSPLPLGSPAPLENGSGVTSPETNGAAQLDVPIKKEGPTPISSRRRKRKVVVKRAPKIVDVLKKMGVTDFAPFCPTPTTATANGDTDMTETNSAANTVAPATSTTDNDTQMTETNPVVDGVETNPEDNVQLPCESNVTCNL